ncbi:MAG: transmembrane sensor [Neolewinella sp.]|jgi:transmembrane sensor
MPYKQNEIDQLASTYGDDFDPDVEFALTKLRSRIDVVPQDAVVRTLARRRWMGIAATVLLLVTVSYFGFSGNSGTVFANNTNGTMEVVLPDGTQVILQEGASLAYASDFNETERRIDLEGQAFFKVYKDKTRPFLAGNEETQLRVTGTEFNLRIEEGELEVEVSEGSVELKQEGLRLPVKANECGLAKPGKQSVLMAAPHLNRHAWRTGQLYFDSVKISTVLEVLRVNFDLNVQVEGGCEFPVSGTYSTEKPRSILENIAKINGGKVAERGDVLYLIVVCD